MNTVKCRNLGKIKQCFNNGANIEAIDIFDDAAYDYALEYDHTKTARYLLGVHNEFKNFKNNSLAITTEEPKSFYLKMLYKNKIYYMNTFTYAYLCSIFTAFHKAGNNKELIKILKECQFSKCSKEELKKLGKIGFPLSPNEFNMKSMLLQSQVQKEFTDLMIE